MPVSSALPTYSAIYAFGDSLSDAGNLSITTAIAGTEPVSPPYYQESYGAVSGNVFSNGPTWVQDLSVSLGLGTLSPSLTGGNDFAFGGAETGSEPQNASDPTLQAISLPAQLTQFQTKVSSPAAGALYTVSIGANDLLAIISSTNLTAAQQTTDVTDAVANEIAFIGKLVGDGAQNFLVLDVPDLGKTPDVMQGIANGSGVPSQAADTATSQLTAEYNTDLTSQLAGITGVTTHVIDGYTLIDNAVANPAAYGLSNVTTPVWSGNFTSASSGTLAATTTAAQDQYLFWDHLHPTETGHQAIAALAEQALGGGTDAAQITQFYSGILQRTPDPAGLAGWEAAISKGTLSIQQVEVALATSAEAMTYVVPVVELYAALGRAPDAAGLHRWVHTLEGGTTLNTVAADFLASPEGQGVYGNGATNTAFVDTAYREALGRTADAAGAQNWTTALDAGALTRAQVLVDLTRSAEAQARDATPVMNFLLAAGNGTANYGGTLFAAAPQPTMLAAASTEPASYGSGNIVAATGLTSGASLDRLQFLGSGATLAGVSGAFGSGAHGTGLSGLTATASDGTLAFAGAQVPTASLAQLITAAGNILDDLAAPANMSAAFQHGGSTYLVATPSAGGVFSLSTDHVFDLGVVPPTHALLG